VKNNLQVMDSMLVLQAREIGDPAAKSALLGLRSRVYALGLVHNQLMGSQDLQTFDIAPFLEELSSNLVEGGVSREVALSVRAVPLRVGLDFAIPLGLLVTELVTNSLKHAFPEGRGRIDVSLERTPDGGVKLVVSDDGTGYAGTPSDTGQPALGTRIVAGLVDQLKGTIEVSSDTGTRSEIRVPAPAAA
jgi:two-component sensor histidine kinase